jgi:hypothetical protein
MGVGFMNLVAPDNTAVTASCVALLNENNLDQLTVPQILSHAASSSNYEKSVDAVCEIIREVTQTDSEEWLLWRRVGITWQSRGNTNIIFANDRGTNSTERKATEILDNAILAVQTPEFHVSRSVLITTGQPYAPIWDTGLESTLKIICPFGTPTSGELIVRSPGGRFTFPLHVMEAPANGVALDNNMGWVVGNTIYLRFHPFFDTRNQRFTAARAEQRVAFLVAVLRGAIPHLSLTAAEAVIADSWKGIIEYATLSLQMAKETAAPLVREVQSISTTHRQTAARLQELEDRLRAAQENHQAAQTALEGTDALVEAQKQRAQAFLEHLHNQCNNIEQMNQVASVKIVQGHGYPRTKNVEVITHPLNVACGENGLRSIPGIRFTIPIDGNEDPSFPDSHTRPVHPLITGGRVDWSAISIPLATAIGSQQLQTATSLICGLLSRPISDQVDSQRFTAVASGRAGFQPS